MKRLLLLTLLVVAALPQVVVAQSGPTGFVPGLEPPAPPVLSTMAGTAPAQGTLTCRQSLADSEASLPAATSPWRSYQMPRAALFSTAQSSSTPQSLFLQADRDGDPQSGADTDAVGQELTIPAGVVEIQGALRYRFDPGSAQAGDELRVELYQVGQVNGAGLITTTTSITATGATAGTWATLRWEVFEPTLMAQLRALERVTVVIRTVSTASPGGQRVWLDDLTASLCAAGVSLSGRVRQGLAGATGARVSVVRTDAAGSRVVATADTDAAGRYIVSGLPSLNAGESYRIWYLAVAQPQPRATGRVGLWAGPSFAEQGTGAVDLSFDVADVELQGPASYAEVVATNTSPVALRWQRRGDGDERHQLCLYDPATANPTTGLPAQLCGPILDPRQDDLAFNLAPASFTPGSGLGLTYGRSYRWYVVVYQRDPRQDPETPYGYSFAEKAITLLPETAAAPGPAPAPDPGSPAPGIAGARWTLLIYVAADNALGNPRLAPPQGRPEGQLAPLAALAATYPNINLVSFIDGYGPGGALLCAYQPSGPDCRQRAEPDSAAPSTLGSFIALGRERYPAAQTALLIMAPGQAVGELALDETTGAGVTALNLAGLQQAYQAGGISAASPLDLIIYQAPLLGTVEAVRATAPYARYLVASPDQFWQLSPYNRLVPLLSGQSDPATVARGAVAAYAETVTATSARRAVAMAAYDLSRAAQLGQRVDALAEALAEALATQGAAARPAIAAARTAAQVYDSSGNGRLDTLGGNTATVEEDALVDLTDLAIRLRDAPGLTSTAQTAAGALADQLRATNSPLLTTSLRSGQSLTGEQIDLSGAGGLAIFFPSGNRLGGQAALADTYLFRGVAGSGSWPTLVHAFLAGSPGIGPGGVTAGEGGPQFRPLPGGFVSNNTYLPLVRR